MAARKTKARARTKTDRDDAILLDLLEQAEKARKQGRADAEQQAHYKKIGALCASILGLEADLQGQLLIAVKHKANGGFLVTSIEGNTVIALAKQLKTVGY